MEVISDPDKVKFGRQVEKKPGWCGCKRRCGNSVDTLLDFIIRESSAHTACRVKGGDFVFVFIYGVGNDPVEGIFDSAVGRNGNC